VNVLSADAGELFKSFGCYQNISASSQCVASGIKTVSNAVLALSFSTNFARSQHFQPSFLPSYTQPLYSDISFVLPLLIGGVLHTCRAYLDPSFVGASFAEPLSAYLENMSPTYCLLLLYVTARVVHISKTSNRLPCV
jgi:hypothetical protein